MTGNPLAGLTKDNLSGPRRPFFVLPGRLDAVTKPFERAGGTVVEVSVRGVDGYEQFLERWNDELAMPMGEALNWDAFADSYEEMAEDWPSPLMFVVHGIDEMARRDLHTAMEVTFYLLDMPRELRRHGVYFIAVFALSRN